MVCASLRVIKKMHFCKCLSGGTFAHVYSIRVNSDEEDDVGMQSVYCQCRVHDLGSNIDCSCSMDKSSRRGRFLTQIQLVWLAMNQSCKLEKDT